MLAEELHLARARLADGAALRDVLLASVDDADVAQSKRHNLAAKVRARVGTAVHDVELGDDSDGTLTVGVHHSAEGERVAVGEIAVGGRHREDEARIAFDVGEDHLANLLLDVGGLVTDGHAGDAGKIH